jgi:hypothetical protein
MLNDAIIWDDSFCTTNLPRWSQWWRKLICRVVGHRRWQETYKMGYCLRCWRVWRFAHAD